MQKDMTSSPTLDTTTSAPSPLSPILNRTIPGFCHPLNQGTLKWGQDGLLAYGSHNMVVVVDPATVQVVQCLNKHRASVVVVDWSTSDTKRLQLASGDAAGQVISWDLSSGEHLRQVHDGNLPVQQLRWVSSTCLLAVHPPNHLVLWDMDTGTKVWKKSYGDSILGFDVSPFHADTLLLRCEHSFLTVTDFSLSKCPKTEGKKFYLVTGKGGSPGRGVEGTEQKMSTKSTKLRRMVRSMVLGEMGELEQQDKVNDCITAVFHPGVKNQVVLAYSKEVLIVDTELGQTVGQINVDRSNSPLAGMEVARQKPVIFLLHESGGVSVWSLRAGLTVASTPIMMSKSQSLLSFASTPATSSTPLDGLLEVSYESVSVSEHVRLGKNCRVLGLALRPSTQTEVSFLTTDGRIFLLNLRSTDSSTPPPAIVTLSSLSTNSMRLTVSAILSSLSHSKAVRMCPPLTTKNWGFYRPLLAVGAVTGHLQVVNVSTGLVEREMSVHSAPVLGLEWTSTNPAASLLSFAHCNVTGSNSGLVRNELVHTDIITGKVRHLRTEQGREAGEPKITMIRVSHLKKYFVVAFASGPFELWDLTKLCILRTMPKKFPHITALEWSPLHTARVKKSGSTSPSEEVAKEQKTKEVSKEHIVMTDHDGQLYHFTVEGHTIKDGTKIPAETGLGTITCISWKSDMIVRGDTEGNVNIWNMKTRQSKNIHTGRGMVKRMSFSPGKNNMKILVLYEDGVQIWDVKELEMINELRSPLDMVKVEDVEWASSDRVVLAGQDGAVRLAGLALAGTSSHTLAYGRDQQVVCMGLLPRDTFRRIACTLGYRPWAAGEDIRKVLTTGLTEEQVGLVEAVLDYLGEQFIMSVSDGGVSLAERYLLVSLALGLMFETELWLVLVEQKAGRPLGRQFHVLADRNTFMGRQEELSRLHMARAVERVDRVRLTAQLICLGQVEAAVAMLLDTDMEDNNSMADQLLACLIQATANRDSTECQLSHVSTMKMVATSLLSEGKLWEGVQLLVLTGKVGDACSYLRSAGHWDQALWLGKCRMEDTAEWVGLASRYSDHLVLQGQTRQAAVTHLAVGSAVAALECLHVGQFRELAHKMLPLLLETDRDSMDQVLEEAVMMETAKLLSELGMKKGFEYYCDKLGRKGEELRLELGSNL